MTGPMYSGLAGKIALVTGGGRGLGKAICLALAREGAKVALTDLRNAEQTAREIEEMGGKALAFSADVLKEPEVKAMVERIVAAWGGIDILVNNVGGDHAILLEDMTEPEWDWSLNINLKGMFHCTRIVAEVMKKRGGGKIINIASLAGLRMTMYGGIAYSAAKAGVLGFTRHAAFELGHYKINVNAVCPGPTLTEVVKSRMTPEIAEKMKKATPLGDFAYPEDQADAVVFLASERARMITGTYLLVDGGVSLPVSFTEWDEFYSSRKKWLKEGRWEGKDTSL
ncbi:MAG TPA: 3-oxoacyl-ACP reductase FabG [Dehalococcoidia bacterium]|nr:3-oxoacyl-ACP reductase FabG [Dehalococcoidia bacterium]